MHPQAYIRYLGIRYLGCNYSFEKIMYSLGLLGALAWGHNFYMGMQNGSKLEI